MIPYYPQNTQQLQQQGLLDLGMRLLQASGPQHPAMSLGARVGQAGVGNMQAMRGAGQQMGQMQAIQAKQAQAKQMQDMRMKAAQGYEGAAMNRGPLSPQESAGLDVGMANILGGKPIGDFSTEALYPEAGSQKAQSPIGKINADYRSGLLTTDQFNKEILDRYKSSGSVSVYEKKLADLQQLKVPRDIAVKVLSGMYKTVSDPISGTVVIDMETNRPIGKIELGKGWVGADKTDPFSVR